MKAAGRNWCVGIACTPRIALNPVSWLEIPYSILIPLFYRVARSYSTLLPILTSFFVMNGKHYLPLFALFSHHLLHYLFPRWIHHRAIHRNRVIYYIPMNPVIQVELRFWARLLSCEWQFNHANSLKTMRPNYREVVFAIGISITERSDSGGRGYDFQFRLT